MKKNNSEKTVFQNLSANYGNNIIIEMYVEAVDQDHHGANIVTASFFFLISCAGPWTDG